MSDFFQLGNRKLIPLKDVPKVVPYSREYVSRLAREGKVAAAQINRQWYIDIESLKNFFEHAQLEVQARTEYVRELRKEELNLHEWWSAFLETQRRRQETRQSRSLKKTVVIVILGLLVGLVVTKISPLAEPSTLASLVQGGQFASLVESQNKASKMTNWYETGEVVTVDESMKNPTGILIMTEGTTSDPGTFFSDPVTVEETSPTTGVIYSSSSSSTLPYVRVKPGDDEGVSSGRLSP